MSGTIRPPPSDRDDLPPPSRVHTGSKDTSPVASAPTRMSLQDAYPSIPLGPAFDSPPPGRASLVDTALVCPTCGVRYPAEFRVCPRDGAQLTDAPADEHEADEIVGQTLANTYSVTRVIGEGGMGRVYEARHLRIGGKRFAIKLLHPEFARRPEVLSRFQREAEASASIRSEYVVEVYDVHRTADGRPFMVGEFLQGRELADHLNLVGKLPVGPAVRITRQLCKGLAVAHSLGIVHRDMKPENVFLTGDLQQPIAKVIDFGISKTGDSPGSQLTKTGMIMGTPSFMAPEQARGAKVDHLVDVYAVGAILYCMVTGQRPFDRGDPTATLTAVLMEEPPRPRTLEPSIPDALEAIIQRAMAKKPSDRYASLDDLARDLAPFEDLQSDSSPTAAASPAPAKRLPTFVGRIEPAMARPLLLLFGGLALLCSLMVLVSFVGAIIRAARDGAGDLSGTEAIVLFVIPIVALAFPGYLVGRVLRVVWSDAGRTVALAAELETPVLAGLAAYGVASLLVRFFESILLRRPTGAAGAGWDILLALFAAGVVGYLIYRRRA